MAIALGTNNKRQVRLVVALFGAIVAIAGWEVYGSLGTSRIPTVGRPATVNAAASTRRTSRSRLEPVLRIDQLARSEQVDYGAAGRNVFSAYVPPAPMEVPIASARPDAEVAAAPAAPVIPPMDLKYLGYAQTKDKTYSAMFAHGNDTYMAKTGDIMFHRFKVGAIQPGSVMVTDLNYDRTQLIPAVAGSN